MHVCFSFQQSSSLINTCARCQNVTDIAVRLSQLSQEQQQQQQQQAAERDAYDGPRDIILVTDADTPTGELVTLQLILLR
jgi:hypothetical protein